MKAKKSAIAKKQMEMSMASLDAADKFAKLKPIGLMPSQQKAIDLANSNVGNYLPDLNRSRELAEESAKGITEEQIQKYTNPYLQDVLNFSIKDMEDAAAQRREQMRAIASRSGNDFASSGASANRFQVEGDLADRSLYREIGGLSATTRANAFNTAAGLASDERGRQYNASGALGNLANTNSVLGAKDVGMLGAAGDLESMPQQNERQHLMDSVNTYNAATNAAQPSVQQYQKTSPLSQILGLVGTVGTIAAAPFTGGASLLGLPAAATQASAALGGGGMGTGGLSNPMSSAGRPSDRRLKRNIKRIGTHSLGIGLYVWDYLWGEHSSGVMADEVKQVMPAAVSKVAGFDVVNYSMIGD